MIEIPKQLRDEKFRFILVAEKSKRPIEEQWTTKNNYSFNESKLLKHLENNNNYGVLCGPGNLFVLDLDVKNSNSKDFEYFKTLETFQVLTGGGGLHLYFLCNEELSEFENETLSIGELKIKGVQVVGPNSIYTNGITKYNVLKDLPIFEFKKDKFKNFYNEIITPYSKKNQTPSIDELQNVVGTSLGDTSRSGIDFKTLRFLIQSNLTQEKIFEQMKESSIRWSNLPASKQVWEYNNAKKSLEKFPEKSYKESYKEKQYNAQFKEETPQPSQRLKFLTEEELMNYSETQYNDWIVKNFFRPKTICLLTGKRSTLKTWLGLLFVYSIAHGIKVFNTFETNKNKSLYADRENSFLELRNRAKMIKAGLGIAEKSDIMFLSETHLKLDSLTDLKELENFIIENKILFIIGDTFRRFVSFEENSADDVSRFFVDYLKPMCERTGACIVLLHHEKKGQAQGDEMDMIRGSSDLANYADTIFQLTRKGRSLTIKQTKQRSAKELEPFRIQLETDEITYMKFKFEGELETTDIQIQKLLTEWILRKKLKDFSFSDAEKFILEKGYKSSSFKTALLSLQGNGFITKGGGKFSKYIVSNELVGNTNHTVDDFY